MLILDFIQLMMISQAGRWTGTPSATPLQERNEKLILLLHLTSDDQPGWSMDSNPIHHLSSAKKMKCSFLDYVQLLMISWAGQWTQILYTTCLQPKNESSFLDYIQLLISARLVNEHESHLPPLSSQKNEMLIFGLRSTSDDQHGWSMDLNPVHHPLQPK